VIGRASVHLRCAMSRLPGHGGMTARHDHWRRRFIGMGSPMVQPKWPNCLRFSAHCQTLSLRHARSCLCPTGLADVCF